MSGMQIILLVLVLAALFVTAVLTVEALAERHDYADKDPIPDADEITDRLGEVADRRAPLPEATRRFAKRVYKLAHLRRAGGSDG